ncbi:MAG TPA: type II secretion system F family protein [Candidatus Limnocylindrales bacterium]|nr:type II secretion system F family protein [Candidatus Limnocylindrales bacterium]
MNAFRYQAIERSGKSVEGLIEADDRRSALRLLTERGLFPSNLEASTNGDAPARLLPSEQLPIASARLGRRIKRKDVTAFTREMSALLGAAIPIPQALDGLGEEEENPAMKAVVLKVSESVRKGASLSSALDEHPRLFSKLYVSMVRVGEEAGALQKVMNDLADLLEHEDEVRGEVKAAAAYPLFVLGFGIVTVIALLTLVLPKLFGMLQEMLTDLPLPTLVLLKVSSFLHSYWLVLLVGIGAAAAALRWYIRTPRGAELCDEVKLRIPVLGSVFRAAALGRFARTLGTLARSGVSLLPALKIVENTIGNRVLAHQIARVAEETRGGHSLATPLRKLGIFPRTVVQMIDVGEETGRLDEMLLRVAEIEERHMRARTKTLISLLAPLLILIVGSLVGFMVIAILLPIFRMSRAIH